jgi:hypothetical protein
MTGLVADIGKFGRINFRFSDIFSKPHYSFSFEPSVLGTKLGRLSIDKVPRNRLAGVLGEANRWLEVCLSLDPPQDPATSRDWRRRWGCRVLGRSLGA